MPVATGRWRGPIRAVRTWRHVYAFLGTPLVAGDDPAAALRELLVAAAATRSGGLVALEWMSADGPVAAALDGALEGGGLVRAGEMPFDRAALWTDRRERPARRGSRAAVATSCSASGAGSRSCWARRWSAPTAPATRTPWSASSSSSRGAGRAARARGSSSRPSHADFFREVCESFAAMGRLQLFELHGGERTVAMKCNLVASPGLFMFKIANDEELARFSPGVQMEVENVDKFHETDLDWIDSCASPENQMINRLWPGAAGRSPRSCWRGAGWRSRASRAGCARCAAARERERRKRSAVT